jgi:hypothetical protein
VRGRPELGPDRGSPHALVSAGTTGTIRPMSKPKTLVLETIDRITETEARTLVERIKGHFRDARSLVLRLYEGEGWVALGYDSWRACVVAEFGQSQSRLYQLLDAAKIEKNISTMVENEGEPIPERTLRPMSGLAEETQAKVWQEAKKSASEGKVKRGHVVEAIKKLVKQPNPKVVEKALNHIEAVTDKKARATIKGEVKPLDIIALAKLKDSELRETAGLIQKGWGWVTALQEVRGRLQPGNEIRNIHTKVVQGEGKWSGDIGLFFHVAVDQQHKSELQAKLKDWLK